MNGVPIKSIQELVGHSDFSTTVITYVHLEYSAKMLSADVMRSGFGPVLEKEEASNALTLLASWRR